LDTAKKNNPGFGGPKQKNILAAGAQEKQTSDCGNPFDSELNSLGRKETCHAP
jgi:hypothetical protein